jgi:hypothetical protein
MADWRNWQRGKTVEQARRDAERHSNELRIYGGSHPGKAWHRAAVIAAASPSKSVPSSTKGES